MTRLLVHVEGQTEEAFVNELLAPHLYGCGYTSVSARLLGNARLRSQRGGIRSWDKTCEEIARHLSSDRGAFATTLVDFYGLPSSGPHLWPGRDNSPIGNPFGAYERLKEMLSADFVERHGDQMAERFVPNVALHEFEGLLFSDPRALARGIARPELQTVFTSIRKQFESPEHINDSPATAPSKRISLIYPEYQKPFHGLLVASELTLDGIRNECKCFDDWVCALESIPA